LTACNQAPARTPKPNVLLVTIDTFRADRLGRGIAPAIDRLAASALTFTEARSVVPLTLPSHTTILTGLLPPVHGARENGVNTLPAEHATVATLLKSAGYDTAAFVGAFVLDRRFGLARGFDTYDDQIRRDPSGTERLDAERPATEVVDRALAWFDQRRASLTAHPAPFFVWIHLYDPHAPYKPPARFVRHPVSTADLYDGEVAYADSEIARVFDRLDRIALRDRTLIVVAGDHGEGLGDHGEQTHGMLLYDSTLRVPLVVAQPGRAPEHRTEPVSLIDLAPTILRACGVTPPAAMSGADLLGPSTHRESSTDLYAETEYPHVAGWSALQALTDGRWKAIRTEASTELFDLQGDPGEEHDIGGAQSATAAAMSARIVAIRASGRRTSKAASTSSEAAERLRALGYVASSAPQAPSNGPNPAAHIRTWNAFEDALAALSSHRPEATAALKTLAAEHPDAPVFQTTYARALRENGRVGAALDLYRRAAKRWPADAMLLHDLAAAARDAGSSEEARRADEAAAVLSPTSATVHNGLALAAVDARRFSDAAREFERALSLDPNNASYATNLGNARRAMHETAGAADAYRRALAIDPRAADAANGLGVLLVETHHNPEAVVWFERALDAQADLVEARLNLGIALQEAGDRARAADAYRAVLATPGSHPREKAAASTLLSALGR
jgi:arylsulfatase A-like enzyme/tetratricopeptide (TPR) repeat protein